LIVFTWCGALPAQQVRSLDFTIHQEYTSTRALGMGNAFTAVADDHSALFYNPATLALRKDGHLRMFVRGGASPESRELFNEIEDVKDKPEAEQDQAYSDLIVSHYGDHFYYRVPTIGAVWVRPNWGIALIPADMSLDIAVHRQIGPMLNINLYQDTTLAFAYARKLKWSRNKKTELSWGATAKSIHRIHVAEMVNAGMLARGQDVFETSHAGEGLTFDIDLAFQYKPYWGGWWARNLQPSFALVGRNLVDYGFKQNFHFIDEHSGEPAKLQRRIDFGSKVDLPKIWVFEPKVALDIRDVLHDNWTWKKGFHTGVEAYWRMFNWWKGHWSAGINQGYWTAGFGARLAWFQLDLCSFGEEVGSPSLPKESRRYMAELALDF
jgi:hypothetical protein